MMWRLVVVAAVLLLLVVACGGTAAPQATPTPDRPATLTAVFDRINKDLGATPTP